MSKDLTAKGAKHAKAQIAMPLSEVVAEMADFSRVFLGTSSNPRGPGDASTWRMNNADRVAHRIIGAAIDVHRQFGPGLLESVYTPCLGQELVECGLDVEIEKPMSLVHKGLTMNRAYVLDLLVEGSVIVEVKSVEKIKDIHVAQLLTYLRLTGVTLGLIINFNVTVLKNGIRRIVHNHVEG